MTDTDWRTDRIRDLAERMMLEKPTRQQLEDWANGEDRDTRDAAVVAIALLTIEEVAPLRQSIRLKEFLKPALQDLLEKTRNSVAVAAGWIHADEKAVWHRIKKEFRYGAQDLRTAHEYARNGLKALADGDFYGAQLYYDLGKDHWTTALERRPVKPGRKKQGRGYKSAGRPTTTQRRNEKLVRAVQKQEERGLKGPAAFRAAINADPALYCFSVMTDSGVRNALRLGKAALAGT